MGVIGLWELLLESPQLLIDIPCYFSRICLLMCKCNENDSASGRLSGWSTAYLDFGQGRDTGLDRPLLSSHASHEVLSRVIEAKF